MQITDIFRKEFIIEELKSKNKRDILGELSRIFLKVNERFNAETMVNVLLEREKLGSTGIGDGIAIPHGKMSGLNDLIISFGRSKDGIDFNAMDGKPVHLFFLLMAPENSAGQHLKILAKLSRMLKDTNFRKKLMSAKSKDELYKIIEERNDAC
jgi:PTS system nitrogen regulatory IIA component